jgi:predicted NAD-dependent protein-ADP-ribosyltransferase YbiA (DUF1768 family)
MENNLKFRIACETKIPERDFNFIVIPKASDKVYGYLSNDSKYGFTEKDGNTYIYWPTVTHYIEAKKFEGTQYEHIIRKARTVTQVKVLSREREIRITTRDISNYDSINTYKVYGNKNVRVQTKPSWESDLDYHLRIAIRAKFKQNTSIYNALVSTIPLIIDGGGSKNNNINDVTANILMEIRGSV